MPRGMVGWLESVINCLLMTGYFISCLSSSLKIASALSAPMIIPLLLFGGFFLNNGSVPVYFQWLRYMSWLMYGNEALSINQWQGIKFDNPNCNMLNGESDMPINTSNSTISVDSLSNATSSIPIIGQICTGEDILNNLNFNVVRSLEIATLTWTFVHSFRLPIVFYYYYWLYSSRHHQNPQIKLIYFIVLLFYV